MEMKGEPPETVNQGRYIDRFRGDYEGSIPPPTETEQTCYLSPIIKAEDDPFWNMSTCGLGYKPPSIGDYLMMPKLDNVIDDGCNENLAFGLSSMQGWRSTMDNAHATHINLDESTSFFGIYVGHGGKAVSVFCSKNLHEEVVRHEDHSTGNLEASVRGAFLRMDELMHGQSGWRDLVKIDENVKMYTGKEWLQWVKEGSTNDDEINGASEEDFAGPTCGSEACTVIIRNNQLVVANLGNSQCVLSSNGQAYSLCEQHSPDVESEKDRIMKAGGFVSDGRVGDWQVRGSVEVSRAIGYMQYKDSQIVIADPSIEVVELCDEDEYIVLACGIWDCMSSQQLVDLIHDQLQSGSKISEVCERVLNRCLAPSKAEGPGRDNMAIILVQLKKTAPLDEAASSEQSKK